MAETKNLPDGALEPEEATVAAEQRTSSERKTSIFGGKRRSGKGVSPAKTTKKEVPSTATISADEGTAEPEATPPSPEEMEAEGKKSGMTLPDTIWKKPAAPQPTMSAREKAAQKADENEPSKIEKASAATTNRAEVIQDARRRSAERDFANEMREKFYSGWAQIQAAMNAKLVLTGEVVSVYTKWKEDPNTELSYPLVFVTALLDKMFKVSIPFSELFSSEALDMSTVDLSTQLGIRKYARRQQTMAAKFVGVEISFLVTHMDDVRDCTIEDHFIAGSRKAALEKERRQNFFPSRRGTPARIKRGDDVEATIIGVANHSIRVCIGGLDVSIPMFRLTFKWVPDAVVAFAPGQKVKLRITDLETTDDFKVKLQASMKPLEREAAILRSGFVNPGMQVRGIITAIVSVDEFGNPKEKLEKASSGGRIEANAWLPGLAMPARITGFPPFRYGTYLRTGDEVLLSVNRMDERGLINAHLVNKVGFQIF